MSIQELALRQLTFQQTDKPVFVPRMDIWYKANKALGRLPDKYRHYSLRDILDDMGFGYHCFVPDFNEDTHHTHYALGIYDFKTLPYRVVFHEIDISIEPVRGGLRTTYKTPLGVITTAINTACMQESGATQPHITEYPLKHESDLEPLKFLFTHLEAIPYPEGLAEFADFIGDRGVIVPFHSLGASPMHYISRTLCAIDTFYYMLADYPEEMQELAESIKPFYDQTFAIACSTPYPVVMSGLNFNTIMTPPDFFKQHMLPSLIKRAEYAHAHQKLLAVHIDGENAHLLDLYLESGFHIGDSICPSPMTSLEFWETYEKLQGRVAITGGIPSNLVLDSTCSRKEFEKAVDGILQFVSGQTGIVLSIADTVPPDANLERIQSIGQRIQRM